MVENAAKRLRVCNETILCADIYWCMNTRYMELSVLQEKSKTRAGKQPRVKREGASVLKGFPLQLLTAARLKPQTAVGGWWCGCGCGLSSHSSKGVARSRWGEKKKKKRGGVQ